MVRKEEVSKYFANCPLCKSNAGFNLSGFPFKKIIECKSCGAKWKWDDVSHVSLKRASNDGTGDIFVEVERPASLWQSLDLEHVDWDKTKKPNSVVLSNLILEKGEKILAGWAGETLRRTTRLGTEATLPIWGNLVLTTKRLLWLEKKETGLLRRKINYHLIHSIMLENILQIMSSPTSKHLDTENVEITDSQGGKYSYKLSRMKEYPSCKPLIIKAIEELREYIESAKRKERVKIVLDFSFLKSYMKKGGLVLQTFRCPNCGAPIKLPESGSEVVCSHCASTIYAQDILEKIKALIG